MTENIDAIQVPGSGTVIAVTVGDLLMLSKPVPSFGMVISKKRLGVKPVNPESTSSNRKLVSTVAGVFNPGPVRLR